MIALGGENLVAAILGKLFKLLVATCLYFDGGLDFKQTQCGLDFKRTWRISFYNASNNCHRLLFSYNIFYSILLSKIADIVF